MRTPLSLTLLSLASQGLVGCGGGQAGGQAGCEADLTITTPDGTQTTLDFCVASSLDADFEFDPDKAPEVRAPVLTFHAVEEGSFQCSLTLSEPGVCGVGYYRADENNVSLLTYDCTDVADDYEGEFGASHGWFSLDTLDAGDIAGDLSGEPVTTSVGGHVSLHTDAGISLSGNFYLESELTAADAEEASCVVSDGDEDDDGVLDAWFGGPDSDGTGGWDGAAPYIDDIVVAWTSGCTPSLSIAYQDIQGDLVGGSLSFQYEPLPPFKGEETLSGSEDFPIEAHDEGLLDIGGACIDDVANYTVAIALTDAAGNRSVDFDVLVSKD